MSLDQGMRVIEGTWEEIVKRSPEFSGHRLQITILKELPTVPKIEVSAASPTVRPLVRPTERGKIDRSQISFYD